MADVSSPLTPEHLDEIRRQIKNLDDADAQIRKAIQAGLDMSAQQKQASDMRNQLLKIAQAYFPGQPVR